ncbi:MAG: glycosyltransferase [Planctomycetota bacterium]
MHSTSRSTSMPGSDGSCRAVREELACRLPVIAAPVDPLPELVEDGVRGLIVAVQPDALAQAMVQLAHDPPLRARLGAEARRHAAEHFSLPAQAAAVEAFYGAVAARRGGAVSVLVVAANQAPVFEADRIVGLLGDAERCSIRARRAT